jgi:hypothetical protein
MFLFFVTVKEIMLTFITPSDVCNSIRVVTPTAELTKESARVLTSGLCVTVNMLAPHVFLANVGYYIIVYRYLLNFLNGR